METVGGVVSFATVTLTAAEVVRLPAASRAMAVSVWAPLAAVVVVQDTEYGAAVTSAPRLAPSSLNCTPPTPTWSAGGGGTETVRATVLRAIGAATDSVGGVVALAAGARTAA